jgi:hypothetical protein
MSSCQCLVKHRTLFLPQRLQTCISTALTYDLRFGWAQSHETTVPTCAMNTELRIPAQHLMLTVYKKVKK